MEGDGFKFRLERILALFTDCVKIYVYYMNVALDRHDIGNPP